MRRRQDIGGRVAFCDGLVAFDRVSTPGGSDEDPAAANKKFAAEVAGPLKMLLDNTPSAVRADVANLEAAVRKAAAGNAAGGEEVSAAKPAIEDWAYDNCGFQRIDVTGKDHAYKGIPKTLDAGKTAIRSPTMARRSTSCCGSSGRPATPGRLPR